MKLNELMHGYLGDKISEKDPLRNIVRMSRIFRFEDLTARNWFLAEILENEKSNHHYGKILIEGKDVKVEVQTHDLNRVTELDQEYAAYCDDIWGDVEVIGGSQAWET